MGNESQNHSPCKSLKKEFNETKTQVLEKCEIQLPQICKQETCEYDEVVSRSISLYPMTPNEQVNSFHVACTLKYHRINSNWTIRADDG